MITGRQFRTSLAFHSATIKAAAMGRGDDFRTISPAICFAAASLRLYFSHF